MKRPAIHSAIPEPSTGSKPAPAAGIAPNWRVIHACEHFRDVLSVVEGQVAVGLRPYIVTPQGAGTAELYLSGKDSGQPPSLSLLRSWQDVRNWRKSLLDCAPESSADLVHAHSFAAGMAAVRGCDCVVYDLRDCIDELALSMGQCEPASWLGRSFRAAEQFILSRVAAVIVHSLGMKEAAEERGATATNIYLIPDPLPPEDEVTASSAQSLEFDFGPQTTVFFVPQLTAARNEKLPPAAMFVLEAFALAIRELPFSRLILEAVAGTRHALREQAAQMGINNQVSFVNWDDAPAAWQSAHVVIALGGWDGEAATRRRPNPICLKALRHGTALLAADLPSNREVSGEGRGCLWFDPTNSRDLGGRMAFFGSNPGFRRALAAAGRAHLLETRSHVALGRQYSHAYRYALSRKKSKPTGSGLTAFFPAANCA